MPEAVAQVLRKSGHATAGALYASLAASDDNELIDLLGAELIIGETHFFRIAPQMQALRAVVLPDIAARRADARRLGIWSAGCSTGEEAYTLAILLHETLPRSVPWDVQLLATDLSHRAIAVARRAVYGEWSFRETPDTARARYFTADGTRWRLSDSIKEMVRFSHLNLMTDAFPAPYPDGPNLDLILCRNVTIYFSPEACHRLYERLAYTLSPGGWLILGPSDPTPSLPTMLEPVPVPGAVLWRRVAGVAPREAPSAPKAGKSPVVPALASSRVKLNTGMGGNHPLRMGEPGQSRPTARADGAPASLEPLSEAGTSEIEVHLLIGLKHLDAGVVPEAIASLRRAAYLDSSHSMAHFGLGKAYLHGGDTSRARAAFSHTRRLLAAMPLDQLIAGGGDMTAEELSFAVDAHLVALGGMGKP